MKLSELGSPETFREKFQELGGAPKHKLFRRYIMSGRHLHHRKSVKEYRIHDIRLSELVMEVPH
jgi:hypothetical protein